MELKPTPIPGCFELHPKLRPDSRGLFVKTFHASTFERFGLSADFREDFYSFSRRGVLRGMHFQTPPHAQVKLVYCPQGRALDVALDLRVGSPTYGKYHALELSAEKGNQLYLPVGIAHGFFSLSEGCLVAYKVSAEYSAEHDLGVRWDSFGMQWPTPKEHNAPLLSDRDRAFPTLSQFRSPFVYE